MLENDAIVVSNLTKKYGKTVALNNVSFSVKAGSVVGLIGPNGAGKSSVLKILTGLIRGTSGDVSIRGISVADDAICAKKYISFMPENNPLPDHMRVGEYLRFRAELKGISGKKIRASTEKVMRQCDLYYEARYCMIKNLSKGFRQRVGLADAMLGNSEIVILDEPTIGLDPLQIMGVRKIITANRGTRTILISSHILSELEPICDKFIIINRGNIVASGTLDDLANDLQGKRLFSARIRGDGAKIRRVFEANGAQIAGFEHLSSVDMRVNFCMPDEKYRILVAEISREEDLFLEKIGRMEFSLEEIFLHYTRRCRDQDEVWNGDL
ncbi:MAG: ABC transporter ATP-binding protein [Puniceicoccales bacterium]|jgi:ABC-2 type transport system ATP-binding protein|nr:ABC transporter ATP-binding protein [Puniceicoccales bacterium]